MNKRRLRQIARHHGADRPHRPCPVDSSSDPCDAALLAAEVTRLRVWADFASDLLDAHIWGFGPGDWQASDALAHALLGSDEAPRWRRDRDRLIVAWTEHELEVVRRYAPERRSRFRATRQGSIAAA